MAADYVFVRRDPGQLGRVATRAQTLPSADADFIFSAELTGRLSGTVVVGIYRDSLPGHRFAPFAGTKGAQKLRKPVSLVPKNGKRHDVVSFSNWVGAGDPGWDRDPDRFSLKQFIRAA
jgi:hypothetical protein